MSFTIAPSSPKHARAERYAHELTKAMKARRFGTRTLSAATGCGRTTVMYWRTGRMLPRLDNALRIAEALDWPRLASLAAELRTKQCLVDGVTFVDDSGSDNRTYCSPSCQIVAEKGRNGVPVVTRAAAAERRLTLHVRTVAAFCRACEPEGRCRNSACELRPVSPLVLAKESVA